MMTCHQITYTADNDLKIYIYTRVDNVLNKQNKLSEVEGVIITTQTAYFIDQ